MNVETGEILPLLARQKFSDLVEMHDKPTQKQMSRNPPRIKGYEKCPCGSGKQFKNCHRKTTQAHKKAQKAELVEA